MKWYLNHAVHGDRPRTVQVEAMRRSGGRRRYGQLLEQRLGKTPLTINEWWGNQHGADLCLVIAPNSFKLDWALAPAEWGLPDVPVGVWPRDPLPEDGDGAHLYAVNYEAARSRLGFKALLRLLKRRPAMLVLDETTAIKNPDSQTAKRVIDLAKEARMVRVLNGTPVTRSVMDLYPQLRALGELDGWASTAFRNRFGVMGGYMGKDVVGYRNEEELFDLLGRCAFRAKRDEWLPGHRAPTMIATHVEMTDAQRNCYRGMLDEFYAAVGGISVSVDLVLTQMDKLRQISSCLLMDKGEYDWVEPPERNPKIRAVLDLHHADGGQGKTIVVHTYRPSGEALVGALEKAGLNPAVIRGRMEPEAMIREKAKFNTDPTCRALVGQQAATCMGHTLTGGADIDRCTRMVFYENSFSFRDRSQMEDRNYVAPNAAGFCPERGLYDLVASPMDEIVRGVLVGRRDLAGSIDEVVLAAKERKLDT